MTKLIKDLIKPRKFKKIKNESAAKRADLIDQCAKLVNRPYPQMAAQLYPFKDTWLQEILDTARAYKENPGARFWNLFKEFKK